MPEAQYENNMFTEEIAVLRGYKVIDGNVFNSRGRKLKPAPCSKGYLRFNVIDYTGKTRTCWIHRLVAHLKFGELLYKDRPDVRHLDGNKLNNLDGNIALGTRSQNLRDTPEEERRARATRMNITKHSKLWAKIDPLVAQGKTSKEIAALTGCSISAAWRRANKLKTQ